MKTKQTKKKPIRKSARKKKAAKPERHEGRDGMNIKQMVVRSAVRQGFRLVELGGLALVGTAMGVKLSF
jgi:hypothetical protein